MSEVANLVKVQGYEVPEGLYYSKEWMWVKVENGKVRIGITDYAQKQLNEVVFAELPNVEDEVVKGEPFGTVESVKSVSDLVAPISGKISEVNKKVSDNLGTLNEDPYNEGWILVISPTNIEDDLRTLMNFEQSVEWHKELDKGSESKMPRKIVIIGANAAGVDAAVAARKTDREAKITLLTKDNVSAYSRCGLPFVLGGHIPSFENLIVYPPSFYQMMKFTLQLETTATNIDTKVKTVDTETKDGKKETLDYDSLILATGAFPFRLPIEGMDKEGVLSLHTLNDGEKLAQAMQKAKTAVVIGSGLVGLEVTEALVERGVKTMVVEMLPSVLPKLLDPDVSSEVQKKFEEKGVTFILGKSAGAILGGQKVEVVSVGGESIPG